jgi:hypothetical protein
MFWFLSLPASKNFFYYFYLFHALLPVYFYSSQLAELWRGSWQGMLPPDRPSSNTLAILID